MTTSPVFFPIALPAGRPCRVRELESRGSSRLIAGARGAIHSTDLMCGHDLGRSVAKRIRHRPDSTEIAGPAAARDASTEARPRVVVVGGLTGGHVMPSMSIALGLRELGCEVLLIGARGQLDERMAVRYGLAFGGLPWRRGGTLRNRVSIVAGIPTAASLLGWFDPAVVVSKGSDVCIPVVLSAWAKGIPVILHESDATPGTEHLLVQRLSRAICLGFAQAAAGFSQPTIVTGNLTRPYLGGGSRKACLRRYGLAEDKPVIAVLGGSQGAESLNRLIEAISTSLCRSSSLIHVCGPGKLVAMSRVPNYVQLEFVHEEIRDIYAAADLVVARAGAATIAEIAAYRIPAILVPYPWAERDHQRRNALVLADRGVATVLSQSGLTPARLHAAIEEAMGSRAIMAANYGKDPLLGSRDSLQRLLEVVLWTLQNNHRIDRSAHEGSNGEGATDRLPVASDSGDVP
jgi:UDP-N-acetylglucosamine--N-acetylmuramyl-(pentapeptide) pyrophosphoryl-undecaprenol N-acetylglucosamine transferase